MLCVSRNSTCISTVLASRTLLRIGVWDVNSWGSPISFSSTGYVVYYPTGRRGHYILLEKRIFIHIVKTSITNRFRLCKSNLTYASGID